MLSAGCDECEHCGNYYRIQAYYCKHCGSVKTKLGDSYSLFTMCPFTVASVGGGGTIAGIGAESYTWQHFPCIGAYCALWDIENECCSFVSGRQRERPGGAQNKG